MREMTDVHIIVTQESDDGPLMLTSPQMPEFVAVYDDKKTLEREYKADIGAEVGSAVNVRVIGHWQVPVLTPEGRECLVRWDTSATPGLLNSRLKLANRLRGLLMTEDPQAASQRAEMLAEANWAETGEVVFVTCLASDRLGWLYDQLHPRGDVLIACMAIADVFVGSVQLASRADLDWPTVEDLGWKRDSTFGELFTGGLLTADEPQLLRV